MKSTEEEIQTIKTLLKDSRTAKYHKRLQIVLFCLMGKSYKEIIELLDCNQTTIWRNVKKYEEFGLDSLLQETRGGRNHAYMTVEEEKAFLARHLKATEAGEFVTIPYFRLISFLHTCCLLSTVEAPWLAKYYATSRTS
ncbi:transposase [Streptococcus pneumoniae]|nr:transposase [Streptococcus pneumoniae]